LVGNSICFSWNVLSMIKHRPVFIVEQATRDVNPVVLGDSDEILIEGPMVDRAEA